MENKYFIFNTNDGLKGVKNSKGDVIVLPRYNEFKYYTSSDAIVSFAAIATRGGKDYLIGKDGTAIYEADEIRPNIGSIFPAIFKSDDKWGMVNSLGNVILEPTYDSIKPDSNGFYFISLNCKEGFIGPEGEIFEPIYDSIDLDADDYLVVTLNGKKGYIDEHGEFTENRESAFYNKNMIL